MKSAARKKEEAPDYLLEDQVGFWLRRAYQRHMAIFAAAMDGLDLTSTQFAALVKLRDLGDTAQTELGRLTGMDRATISGVVARLQKRGLVRFRPDPEDGRARIVALTETGAALLTRALERIGGVTEQTLAPVGAAEADALRATLRKLG